MPWKAAGATPTTVNMWPESVTVLPTIAGSSWKRRCQQASAQHDHRLVFVAVRETATTHHAELQRHRRSLR